MNAYCQQALQVLRDQRQTWQAKWIASEILANAGFSKKEIDLLQNRNGHPNYDSLSA